MTEEIWKNVIGFELNYQISNLGNFKSLDRTKLSSWGSRSRMKSQLIKPVFQKKSGYQIITLRNDILTQQKLLHRVVAIHFIPNINNKPCINHINGIKTDNRVENLEWCTYKENNNHAIRLGLTKNKFIPFYGINIINGEKIYFDNINDAALFVSGNRGNIHKCLRKKNNRIVAYGYRWEYCHISDNLISKIQSPMNNIRL